MGALSPTHWLIVIGIVVVLFGAKKLPEAARGLGRSARILKAEVHGITEDPVGPADEIAAPAATPASSNAHDPPASVGTAPADAANGNGSSAPRL